MRFDTWAIWIVNAGVKGRRRSDSYTDKDRAIQAASKIKGGRVYECVNGVKRLIFESEIKEDA